MQSSGNKGLDKRQAKKYHPDRHQDKSAEEIKEMEARFAEAKRAYEWLKNNH